MIIITRICHQVILELNIDSKVYLIVRGGQVSAAGRCTGATIL